MEIVFKKIAELERKVNKQLDINKRFLTRIQELESKVCNHEWHNSFNITQKIGEMTLPDGGKAAQVQLIPIKVCVKCFSLRQYTPEEVAEMQKKADEGIILPGDSRVGLITPP